MRIFPVDKKDAEFLFRDLSRDYKIIAPIEKIGQGRLSDTDLVTYDEVKSFEEIEFFKKSYFTAKTVLFPVREAMFEFQGNTIKEIFKESPPTILFLRACDINAISVTDAHFLKDGGKEDNYYKANRSRVKFFLIECRQAFDNCFCVSMAANKTEDYSAFIRKTGAGYEIGLKGDGFKEYFLNRKEVPGAPNFIEKDPQGISVPEEIDVSVFGQDLWKEYSSRCIGCGRCNTSCPTCTCFTIQDTPKDDDGGAWHRKRIWSSCQAKKFSLLAGTHDFRIPQGDRMRYKVLHKIRDFKKRHGMHMCVGCGRCDEVCPEYISMLKCVQRLNEIIEAPKK